MDVLAERLGFETNEEILFSIEKPTPAPLRGGDWIRMNTKFRIKL